MGRYDILWASEMILISAYQRVTRTLIIVTSTLRQDGVQQLLPGESKLLLVCFIYYTDGVGGICSGSGFLPAPLLVCFSKETWKSIGS